MGGNDNDRIKLTNGDLLRITGLTFLVLFVLRVLLGTATGVMCVVLIASGAERPLLIEMCRRIGAANEESGDWLVVPLQRLFGAPGAAPPSPYVPPPARPGDSPSGRP